MPQRLEWRIDINAPLTTIQTPTLLMQGDNQANVLAVRLTDKGSACDLSGYTVSLWLERRDGVRVPVDGRVEGNLAEVTLPEACYRVNGRYVAFMRITNAVTGEKRTILRLTGVIESEGNGPVLDEEDTIPSLEELLAQIDAMEQATATANEAAVSANTAAQSAQTAAQQAQTAASMAEPWASATATAESLPTGSAPTVAVTDTDTGRAIVFGIPRGEKGEKGEKGDPGNGSATTITVNGIEPSGDNITLTAADVGALPATIEGVTEPMLIITDASGNIIASTTFGGNLTINGTLTANRVVGAVYA